MNLDMTKGSPLKLILRFLLPVLLGNLFQQLYNMVDTIIVGRYVGQDALAAVGATGTISFLILGFMMGIATGFTVMTAQKYGAGDYEGVRKSVGNAFVLSAIVTVIMTALSVAGMDWMLKVMQTPEDIFEMSKTYISIICWGLVCTILYNLTAAVLRAVGNSRVPLYFLVVSALLNVVLDLVFILVFHWGVGGAAAATVISQGISGLLCLFYLLTRIDFLKLKREHFVLERNIALNQVRIAVPMALQFSITAIGTMMVQAALNMLGSTIVAAYTAACKIEQMVTTAFQAMGATMATYSAQNWGIHSLERLQKGSRTAAAISGVYAVVIYGVVWVLLPYATALFFEGDISAIIGYVRTYIGICGIFFIPLGLIFIYRNLLQGCGYTVIPTMGGVVELVSRGIFAFLAAGARSYTGVCIANASAWCTAGIFLWIAYLIIMRGMVKKERGRAGAQDYGNRCEG